MVSDRGPLLDLQQVARGFATAPTALVDATFTVEAGQTVAIVGPSGSGKSTLLSILGLLDQQSSGTYRCLGQDTSALSNRQKSLLRREHMSFVFQGFHLVQHLTTLENVALSLEPRGVARLEAVRQATQVLDQVGLSHRLNALPRELSGGEQQRTAVARALIRNPQIFFCDEPTGNLDSKNSASVIDLIVNSVREDSVAVIVTHDLSIAERCDQQVHVIDGVAKAGVPLCN